MNIENPLKIAKKSGCDCENISEDEKFSRLGELLGIFKNEKGNLISSLYLAQSIFGYLPEKVIKFVAQELNYPVIKVEGVATFYSFFSKFPKGKFSIKICLGTACYVRGGKAILEKIKKDLKIDVGETTEDGLFSLEVVRCVGACALAPVVVVNNLTHRRLKENKIGDLLNNYKKSANIGGETK
ncbi:MAG: NAD(P)H-dependent oxidoreductase subunit E [Spirochaetes bacterium]|nr:NAD(P)H-dependent oxidoreductase subunit E [Spirochaetota bacterium]